MLAQSRILANHGSHDVWEIGLDRLQDVTTFVFAVYYTRFGNEEWEPQAAADYAKMWRDDRQLAPQSRVFAAVSHDGTLLSTARTIERGHIPLPIERDFAVTQGALQRVLANPLPPRRVFEVARLATDPTAICASGIDKREIVAVTDSVITQVIAHTSREPGNVWVASMDVRALSLFRSRGFAFADLGPTDPAYLGSPTTPVALSIDRCRAELWARDRARHDHYFGHLTVAAVPTAAHAPRATATHTLWDIPLGWTATGAPA